MTTRLYRFNAADCWDIPMQALDLIDKALEYNDDCFLIINIINAIKQENMQLWIVFNDKDEIHAIAVTEVREYPQKLVLTVLLAAGFEVDEWLHHLKTIESYAKEFGCHYSTIYGRDGWIKKLKPYGYEKTHVVLRKKL